MAYKVGDKVKVNCYHEGVPYGTVLTVKSGPIGTGGGGNYRFEEYDGVILGYRLDLVSSKPTKNQRITALESEVATLKSELSDVKKVVEALKKAQQTPTPSEQIARKLSEALTKSLMPSAIANSQRKAIIDEAKAFYTETLNEYQLSDGEVIILGNDKERSISVTIRHIFSLKPLLSGIAKCAPDDVFNADIGKAIALGRALGLDVARFEQAVKPTKYAVGQIVQRYDEPPASKYKYRVDRIGEGETISKLWENGKAFCTTTLPLDYKDEQIRSLIVVDDTEAQY